MQIVSHWKQIPRALEAERKLKLALGILMQKEYIVVCLIDKFMNNMMTILQISFQWKQTETKICSSLNISLPMFTGYAPKPSKQCNWLEGRIHRNWGTPNSITTPGQSGKVGSL